MDAITIHAGYLPGAIGRIVELHGTYYAEHWNLGLFFEAKAAAEIAAFLQDFDQEKDGLWLALRGRRIVGAIVIVGRNVEEQGARLRWFILDPEVQGQGVGNKLMHELMSFCERQHFKRVYLTTFAGLDAARHLYEKWGFHLVQEVEDVHWGSVLTEQMFEKSMG
jgi:RimJ/RimL family protein N-acetyltransferase